MYTDLQTLNLQAKLDDITDILPGSYFVLVVHFSCPILRIVQWVSKDMVYFSRN